MPEVKFSLRRCYRILRKGGAGQVSDESVAELRKSIEDIALEVSRRAALFADDASRVKVTAEDVRSAVKEFLERKLE